MIIEILGNSLIGLMDTSLLYLFAGLFMQKRNLSRSIKTLSFLMIMLMYSVMPVFSTETSLFKILIFFLFYTLFCFCQFHDKWLKYVVNVGLFVIILIITETLTLAIVNMLMGIDPTQISATYDLANFFIALIIRLVMLMAILLIKSMLNRSIRKKQWQILLLMPIVTTAFIWFIYNNYLGINSEIDKLLTYVSIFMVIQNAFVFFYVVSLKSSTRQYFEMKEVYERQKQYSGTITVIQKTVRKMAHDIRHHFIYLMSALEQEDIPKAKGYLTQLDENLDNMIPLNVTGHFDVDALLHAKASIAEKTGVKIRVEGTLPPEIMVSPIDLSALLGNSLDNAIEAACRVDTQREILVSFGYNASRLNYTISNPFSGQIQKRPDGYYRSQKLNGGLGIEIIDEVVKKYNGALLTEINDDKFTLTAMLQTQSYIADA